MSKRTLSLIFVLIIIAVFVAGAKNQFIAKRINLSRTEDKLLFPNFNPDGIDKIEVIQGEQKIYLAKEGDNWQRQEATTSASPNKITSVFESIKKMNKKDLASQNPEKRSVFSVDKSGLRVILKQGDKTQIDFWLGKRGPDFLSTYVRREGEDEVWLIPQTLDSIFNPTSWE